MSKAGFPQGTSREEIARFCIDVLNGKITRHGEPYATIEFYMRGARVRGFRAGIEAAALQVDECNREGPFQALGAAKRIRALKP